MSLLESHLEQIVFSSNAISELQFPQPRIFTNALLGSHEITALIRDTEVHERALFQVDPSAARGGTGNTNTKAAQRRATRRGTIYPADGGAGGVEKGKGDSMISRINAARNNRSQSAVARVLGSDMMEEIKRSTGVSGQGARGEVNVDVLLRGAEILCNVYPVAGAQEKIATLRYRQKQITESIGRLEDRVARNTAELEQMSRSYDDNDDDDDDEYASAGAGSTVSPNVTDEDIQRELDEIRELETKRRTLEDRVNGMDRDLGGLLG